MRSRRKGMQQAFKTGSLSEREFRADKVKNQWLTMRIFPKVPLGLGASASSDCTIQVDLVMP
jgi:hypothetical protein